MFYLLNDRELWGSSERHVRKAISNNVQVLQRMCLQRTLQGHMGCVNTCSFDTEAGSILITGSDDQQIILWDWDRGVARLRFDSGHANNVFQARMLPHTGGTRIVTCAADGQVRLAELPEGASSVSVTRSLLASHEGRAHKLALDLLNPAHCFYSSGEDGQVIHFDLRCGTGATQNSSSSSSSSSSRSGARRKLLVCRGYSRARGPTPRVVGLNAIHVNPSRPWQFAVGGDDPWARVYDIRKTRDLPNPSLQNPSSSSGSSIAAVAAAAAAAAGFRSRSSSGAAAAAAIGPATRQEARDSRVYAMVDEPVARLCAEGLSREGGRGFMGSMSPSITCVMFSQQGELLASYNDEDIYLFSPQASSGSLGSSSSRDTSSTSSSSLAAAAEQGGSGRSRSRQQQQQQQADSPLQRSRAAAADTGTGVPQQQQQRENTEQQLGQQQQQQQRYYEDEDAERPRWRRRQRLRQTANSAAATADPAADQAAAGNDIVTDAAGVAMDPCKAAQQPASAAAADGRGISSAAAAVTAVATSEAGAAATRGVDSPIGAVTDADDIEMQRGSSSNSQQQQQQQQGSAGPPACGFGRGFGIPAARFYDLESSGRDGVVASYYGHRNSATVKGVSFFGENDEYVMSGSDCGHVYIWSKHGGEIVWWQTGDDEVVNCLEPHPLMPHVLATSGIEHDVKIWSPTASKPSPPPPASLRTTMAANKRDRQTQRQAMSEPEQWLLQLLAAQRRRAAAAARNRAPGPREGAAEVVDNATTAAARNGAAARRPSGDAERNIDAVEGLDDVDDPMEDEDTDNDDPDVDEEDEDDADVFARFVLPGGGRVVRVRLAGRRRSGRDGGVGVGSDEQHPDHVEDSSDAEAREEDSDGGEGDDRPCYVS